MRDNSTCNVLAGPYIERAAHFRKNREWLDTALADPRTLYVPVWRTHSLVKQSDAGLDAQFVERRDESFAALSTALVTPTFLGLFRERACFAVAVDGAHSPPAFGSAEFQDLRGIVGALPRDEAGVLAYARALVTWQLNHRFCGRCGAHTELTNAGHAAQCTNAACRHEQFPRIDPAIIVLVTDGERALFGRQAAWRPGWYSTIAGFVEAGESLEDAVRREVAEEAGVEVGQVVYHSSQPWPFPQSLMLGFIAQARTLDIQRRDDELEDVRWFSRAEIASGSPQLPPPISISGRLIEDWYDGGSTTPLRDEPTARRWHARPR